VRKFFDLAVFFFLLEDFAKILLLFSHRLSGIACSVSLLFFVNRRPPPMRGCSIGRLVEFDLVVVARWRERGVWERTIDSSNCFSRAPLAPRCFNAIKVSSSSYRNLVSHSESRAFPLSFRSTRKLCKHSLYFALSGTRFDTLSTIISTIG
jgi:hypothetical protein